MATRKRTAKQKVEVVGKAVIAAVLYAIVVGICIAALVGVLGLIKLLVDLLWQ